MVLDGIVGSEEIKKKIHRLVGDKEEERRRSYTNWEDAGGEVLDELGLLLILLW